MDILLPNTKVAFRPTLNENWFVHPLIAEHGFCAAIKLQVNGTEHRLLFDSGLDPLAASHNAEVLGFDLSNCELVISSHGRIDHAGGLLNIIRKINRTIKSEFCFKWVRVMDKLDYPFFYLLRLF